MDEFEVHTEMKLGLIYRHDMYWFQKWLLKLGKVCQIRCQNFNFCYVQRENQDQIKQVCVNEIKWSHKIIGKNLDNSLNSANFISTTGV